MALCRDFRTDLPGDPELRLFVMPSRRKRTRGQSVVEFALVMPVLLLLMLTAIDFGRVFLGWVNLQQMTRIAANHAAEHASAWGTPGDAAEKAKYQTKVMNDARLMVGCKPPNPIPDPIISQRHRSSALPSREMTCEFGAHHPDHLQHPWADDPGERIHDVSRQGRRGRYGPGRRGAHPGGSGRQVHWVSSVRLGPIGRHLHQRFHGCAEQPGMEFPRRARRHRDRDRHPQQLVDDGNTDRHVRLRRDAGQTCTFGVSLRVANAGGTDTRRRPTTSPSPCRRCRRTPWLTSPGPRGPASSHWS